MFNIRTITLMAILIYQLGQFPSVLSDLKAMNDTPMVPFLKSYLSAVTVDGGAGPATSKPNAENKRPSKLLVFICKYIPFLKRIFKRCRMIIEDAKLAKSPVRGTSKKKVILEEILKNLLPPDSKSKLPTNVNLDSIAIVRYVMDEDGDPYYSEEIVPRSGDQIKKIAEEITGDPSPDSPLKNYDAKELEKRRKKLLEASSAPSGETEVPVNPVTLVLDILGEVKRRYGTTPARFHMRYFGKKKEENQKIHEEITWQPVNSKHDQAKLIEKLDPIESKQDFLHRFPDFDDKFDNNVEPFTGR